MTSRSSTRQGPLKPRSSKDAVVVEDPSRDSIRMTADEADLSAFRMLDAAAEARASHDRGERDE
ncbi:MAG: hypothetical protein KKG69_03720 [Alphaproteobacteria bacterium]|uniref:Uncharacterized protein n=1 Tax=Brevundimonas mediterranea TaxID=74329 RepID=A0A7Z9C5I1_9CAUL|nr:hypothetical protein [Brevundimonas mediterranea]MBU2031156.1 hypothetical protein [Alphaproteobacteria bacterium]TAJ40628.1 MAG: hypothetical protein EPO54_11795 [Brevundimonas sp.]MBU2163939.1 hypothetical protein [Alphaproteobacteria bacterium]MBU2230363.1 hypothetical protein [Alphaproteobacteria bacterium]VDC50100.1 hypothetical protein BREV_BREV_00176 [Brevundimonas mediterranea]